MENQQSDTMSISEAPKTDCLHYNNVADLF